MILLIDNYDSFTYNLYQYLRELGAQVQVRRNDQLTAEEALAMNPAALVFFSGSGASRRSRYWQKFNIGRRPNIPARAGRVFGAPDLGRGLWFGGFSGASFNARQNIVIKSRRQNHIRRLAFAFYRNALSFFGA